VTTGQGFQPAACGSGNRVACANIPATFGTRLIVNSRPKNAGTVKQFRKLRCQID
jgi:hypothetical protein